MKDYWIGPVFAGLLSCSAPGCAASTSDRRPAPPTMLAAPAPATSPRAIVWTATGPQPVERSMFASVPGPADCTMHPELVPGGIALVFSASGIPPERVRERVRALSAHF